MINPVYVHSVNKVDNKFRCSIWLKVVGILSITDVQSHLVRPCFLWFAWKGVCYVASSKLVKSEETSIQSKTELKRSQTGNILQRDIEALPWTYCYYGKTINITYFSLCVCVCVCARARDRVSMCSRSYPASKAHALYYTVTRDLFGCTPFFYIVS